MGGPLLSVQAQRGTPHGDTVSFEVSGAVFLNSGFQQPDRTIGIEERAAGSIESPNTRKEPRGRLAVLGRDDSESGSETTSIGQAGRSR